MAGECRVGTEVAVANQPKVCSTAAEGVLSPSSRTCTSDLAPERGLDPRPLRLIDPCTPFRNAASNSLSVTACRRASRFVASVAVRRSHACIAHRGISRSAVVSRGAPFQATRQMQAPHHGRNGGRSRKSGSGGGCDFPSSPSQSLPYWSGISPLPKYVVGALGSIPLYSIGCLGDVC